MAPLTGQSTARPANRPAADRLNRPPAVNPKASAQAEEQPASTAAHTEADTTEPEPFNRQQVNRTREATPGSESKAPSHHCNRKL